MEFHWLFEFLSTCITFPLLVFFVRWIGQTQMTQTTYFNWVAGACMGNIGANMLTARTISGVFSNALELFLFSVFTIIASIIALKSRTFRSITNGVPMVLVNHGQIIYENLKKSKVNQDLLKQMLREQGHFNHENIEWAILEPTGSLSVLQQTNSPSGHEPPKGKSPLDEKRQKNQHIK